jgi:hypothetical protein
MAAMAVDMRGKALLFIPLIPSATCSITAAACHRLAGSF